MQLKNVPLISIESFINQLISLDKETQQKLATIDNQEFAIIISNLQLNIFAYIQNNYIYLDNKTRLAANNTPAVIISATSANFLKLLLYKNNNKSVANYKNINITGDLESAQILQSIISSLEIDWEEQLALTIGDAPANTLGNLVKAAKNKTSYTATNIQEMLSEYIKYEKNLAPSKEQVHKFIADVDETRSDYDRLEARINRLQFKCFRENNENF